MKQKSELEKRAALLRAQLNAGNIRLKVEPNKVVPTKKQSKPKPYKMQNTFKSNLRGVPGGSWFAQAQNPKTGTKVRKDEIGVLRSARNCNTTQGSYIRTVVRDEDGNISSDAQGRKVFGR